MSLLLILTVMSVGFRFQVHKLHRDVRAGNEHPAPSNRPDIRFSCYIARAFCGLSVLLGRSATTSSITINTGDDTCNRRICSDIQRHIQPHLLRIYRPWTASGRTGMLDVAESPLKYRARHVVHNLRTSYAHDTSKTCPTSDGSLRYLT